MSSDVITNLYLDKELDSSRVIVAQEINGSDSTFIVSCVLGHCIKRNNAVLLVSTHNSISHYQNVGLKMNYNLKKYIDTGLVSYYNLGEDNVNSLMINESVDLQKYLLKIKEMLMLLGEKFRSVSVILDGVSHLFNLGYQLREVNNFCKSIIYVVRSFNNSFLFCHCNIASEDDVSQVMANLLAHMAYTVVEVENLSSGLSADVSGHMTIRHPGQKYESEHMFTMALKPSKYLFKLFDRGVKLFAPGTV